MDRKDVVSTDDSCATPSSKLPKLPRARDPRNEESIDGESDDALSTERQ